MSLLAPVQNYIGTLVHPSAQQDALTAARHRAFIAPRFLGGIAALASCPVYLIARGMPGTIELMVAAWLVALIVIAGFLSRTGQYEGAYVLSSLALTGLVTTVALMTGGIASFAAIWLVLVPVEAAFSGSRRLVAIASIIALAAAGLLIVVGARGLLGPDADGRGALAGLGIISAALYATSLALGAERLMHTSSSLLGAEEERYRLLARHMADVITRHGRDAAVLFVSPGAESLFGCGPTELLGRGLFERVHVADRPAYLTALGDTAALGESRSVEFRARRDIAGDDCRDVAQFIWIEMRCHPFAPAGNFGSGNSEVVAVLRDVTERKRQQQALERAHAEAERANAAKGRFLATMSHELRTPLNAIIGFSDMLKNEPLLRLDAARRREYAGLIHESGHHLLGVINGILDVSKIETGNFEITPEPFAPAQVVAGCCDLLALRAREAGVKLEKRIAANLPEMIADRRALNQILLNLVSNAIRFTDRGGKVTVSARAEAGSILFMVEDTGVGISEADLARLGEPYFQARGSCDRSHGGTGLGLSIVKGLVQLQGGELNISSKVGEGTRVSVRLPLDCERTRATDASGAEPAGGLGRLRSRRSGAVNAHQPRSLRESAAAPADFRVKKSA